MADKPDGFPLLRRERARYDIHQPGVNNVGDIKIMPSQEGGRPGIDTRAAAVGARFHLEQAGGKRPRPA